MKLITKVVCVLRSAIAKVGCFGEISRLSHLAAFSPCETTDFYRFGVHKEEILTVIHSQVNPLAYGFTQPCRFFLRSLNCLRDIRLGIFPLYSCSLYSKNNSHCPYFPILRLMTTPRPPDRRIWEQDHGGQYYLAH